MNRPNLIDLTGKEFGLWTVIEKASPGKNYQTMWLCQCECGTVRAVSSQALREGRSRSCGCLRIYHSKK